LFSAPPNYFVFSDPTGLDRAPHDMAEAVVTPVSRTEVTEKSLSVPFTVYGLVGFLGALVLGAVFLFAAWAKAIHPTAFVEAIASRGLTFGIGAGAVAFLALALEAGLGALLVLGVRRLWVLVPAALLVGFFLFLTGQDYYRSLAGIEVEGAACGCFGTLVQRTPAEAFWQDLLLLVPALLLAFAGRSREQLWRLEPSPPRYRLGFAAALTAAVLVLAWKAPELPLDDLATRLKPGVATQALCAGSAADGKQVCLGDIVPELAAGEHVVVLADLDEAFGASVEQLNAYHWAGGDPALWVVSAASEQERFAFRFGFGPAFEVREAPPALLRPLYRTLPRSFLVRAGKVVETHGGLPPLERWRETP
jgi:hypothetical protein